MRRATKIFILSFILIISQNAFALMFGGRVYEGNVGDESTPIPNVTVRLYGAQNPTELGSEIISTTTNSEGWYGLTIREGYEYYNIVEEDPSGYYSVGATSVDGDKINNNRIQYSVVEQPLEDQTLTGNKFWDKKTDTNNAEIGDFVWFDSNGNGIQDGGETGVSDVGVELLNSSKSEIAATTTNTNGNYKFSGLSAGNYYVRFILTDGTLFTLQDQGGNDNADSDANPTTGETGVISLSIGQANNSIDAGLVEEEVEPARVGDFVWNDTNQNGIQDAGEAGIANITVEPFTEDGVPYPATTTNASGNYSIENLPPGNYYLVFYPPTGYSLTTMSQGGDPTKDSDVNPSTGQTDVFTLSEGEYNRNIDAGMYQEQEPQQYDFGDLPDPTFATYLASNGPRHIIDPDVYLGSRIDAESDGQPNSTATGDDNDGSDDDDGVTISSSLVPGSTASITVTASTFGVLYAWIDFDRNGNFDKSNEKVFSGTSLSPGANSLTINVPSDAVSGTTFARFRFSLNSSLDPTGSAPDGEVEDYQVEISKGQTDQIDFGDAPDPKYPTLIASNGARHTIKQGVYLGSSVDGESNGQQSANADGDDTFGNDDEDGIVFQNDHVLGAYTSFVATASVKGNLGAWVDFNGDGDWSDKGESIFNHDTTVFAGTNHWSYIVPQNAKIGKTFARFRYSTAHGLTYDGAWQDGEVEDYEIEIKDESQGGKIVIAKNARPHDGTPFHFTGDLGPFAFFKNGVDSIISFKGLKPWSYQIKETVPNDWNCTEIKITDPSGNSTSDITNGTATLVLDGNETIYVSYRNRKFDYGDAPDPTYPTLLANNGARHTINSAVYLGSSIDGESNGQQSSHADGDDSDGNDDDDGIVFQTDHVPGSYASFVANASTKGALGVWVDFNGDGDWDDKDESIFNSDTTVFAGANHWSYKVPDNAKRGKTFARFRYSMKGGQTYDGPWQDGEVEDYEIEIKEGTDLGIITLIKVAAPADNTPFDFTSDLGPFTLKYPADSSITFAGLKPGTYNFKETASAGWPTISIQVYDPNGGSSVDAVNRSAKVVINANEHVVVAFGNSKGDNDNLDFGDAPDPTYPTLLTSNGARHTIVKGFHLGSGIDAEPNGLQSALADGDDNNVTNDEDGVIMSPYIAPGQSVPITIVASAAGIINAWIDYNVNGSWSDANEHVLAALPVNAGANSFTINVPASAVHGLTFARFRFSSIRNLSYNGSAPDGEVEDYVLEIKEPDDGSIIVIKDSKPKDNTLFWFVASMKGSGFGWKFVPLQDPLNNTWTILNPSKFTDVGESKMAGWTITDIIVTGDTDNGSVINLANGDVTLDWDPGENIVIVFKNEKTGAGDLDFGDAPDPTYPTLLSSNGARHTIVPGFYLGSGIDAEPDGYQSALADGDNTNGTNDEDGVSMSPFIAPGQSVPITIVASAAGVINAWIDFNLNGTWSDVNEHIIPALPVNAGSNSFTINVPAGAAPGLTFARFRFSSTRQLSYDGAAPDGEVEDYPVEIKDGEDGSIKIIKDAMPKDNTPFLICMNFSGGFFTTLCSNLMDPLNNQITILNPSQVIDVTEYPATGWTLKDITITGDTDNGSNKNISGGKVTLDWDPGENIIITFKNEKTGGEVLDFGDAPDPTYPTLLASNGARHTIKQGFYLGAGIDAEQDGWQSPFAYGDNLNGVNDEDGVFMSPFIAPGQTVPVTIVASAAGAVNAWIDFNLNGNWSDPNEHIIPALPVNAGANSFTINVPASAQLGLTFARFRFSSVRNLNFDGAAPDGEVEDYPVQIKEPDDGSIIVRKEATPKDNTPFHICVQSTGPPLVTACYWLMDPLMNQVTILNPGQVALISETPLASWSLKDITISGDMDNGSTIDVPNGKIAVDWDSGENIVITFKNEKTGDGEYDFGDAPDKLNAPLYPTIHAHGGAYHTIASGFYLGNSVDPDINGQPDPHAKGDDNDGNDDEDGVAFPFTMFTGQTISLVVTASTKGLLNAWIDYNQNQDWSDAGEQIFIDTPLNAGPNNLTFSIPGNAKDGTTFARFRLSQIPGLSFTGWGHEGEVEDYEILIHKEGEGPAIKWLQPPLKPRNPDFDFPECFWGWDQVSILHREVVADDWFCRDERPVTAIRWWGSYLAWDQPEPPEHAPIGFHLGIWTDVPKGVDRDWSHPGELVWSIGVDRSGVNEKPVGCDFKPGMMEKPDVCFEYFYEIPTDAWFFQEGDSTVYWLTIAAIYEEIPEEFHWGWKTREHYFNDMAVTIHEPKELTLGAMFLEGEPIFEEWDMTFVLMTTEYIREFDFGDAPEPMYQSMFETNGAHHFVDPDVYLGSGVDIDENGLPHEAALGDDENNTDDEDGVFFVTDIIPSKDAEIKVTASIFGYLNAWIDYDFEDGWNGENEKIFFDAELKPGDNLLNFHVLDEAKPGETFARFRFSTVPELDFLGLAFDGEVEDYKVTIKPLDKVAEVTVIPTKFALYQNYPNPFNPTTEIKFDIPRESYTKLVIYDLRGRIVRTLVNENKQPAAYSVIWDGKNDNGVTIPSGLYFYSLTTDNFRKAMKLLLVK